MAKQKQTDDEDREAGAIVRAARMDASRLIGDTGDFFLSVMKAARELKPWAQMTEVEQRELIEQAKHQATSLVAGIVEAISTRGLPHMPVKINDFSGKMGEGVAQIKCVMAFDEDAAKRLAQGTSSAIIVFASVDAYESDMLATPEPDQRALEIIDAETGEISNAA